VTGDGAKIDVRRFLKLFLEEASDHLTTLESGLLRLEEVPDDRNVIDNVFRAAHSLKGGSSTFGLQEVGRLTHAMESRLERVRTGGCEVTPALTSLLLRATDELRVLLAAAEEGGPVSDAMVGVMAELEQGLGTEAARPAPPAPRVAESSKPDQPIEYEIFFRPDANIYRTGGDPLLVLRDLAELGEIVDVTPDVSALPAFDALDPESSYLAWSIRLHAEASEAEVREAFAFVEEGSEIRIAAKSKYDGFAKPAAVAPTAEPPATAAALDTKAEAPEPAARTMSAAARAPKAESASIRVAIDKVDKLINLVGEMVIAQSMISQVAKDFTPEKLVRLQESVGEMERNIRELQERVMSVRMVPLSTVFSRVPRLVRDLAGTLDKKVNIQVTGGETEIDRSVIEQIGDPLTHLIRNAVDHGIETPDERVAAGKPEQGQVKLSAFHQGGNVIIHIEDDGRGLDTDRIRKKALGLGLLKESDEPTREALHALIFRAGFSTAAKVTDVSGRGVGMDVVKTNIEALNGSITLESEKGRGTRFRISLPLTLAIIDGLCVGVGDELYVVPLVSIIESFRPGPTDIKTVGGRGEVVMVRGKVLPLLRLRRLLAVRKRPDRTSGPPLVVIIEHQGATVGLLVDDILGQAQVVIKSLETNFRRVEGVMGATIMGDGRVALILDVQGLTRIAHRARPSTTERTAEA
jgi:two-component system, chemotaxis family, sensor kinase CheA